MVAVFVVGVAGDEDCIESSSWFKNGMCTADQLELTVWCE